MPCERRPPGDKRLGLPLNPEPVREATPERDGTRVSRAMFAYSLPAALVFVVAAMVAAMAAGTKVRLPWQRGRPEAALNALLGMLPPFMLALHAGVLARTAGYAIPIEQIMTAAVGLLLIALGLALPRITPEQPGALAREWRRAQRPGGAALALVGAGCLAGAWLLPPLMVAVAAAMMVAVVYLMMVLIALARLR